MASTYLAQDRSVSVGRIFSRAFGAIGSNPLTIFGIAFLFGALPGLLFSLLSQQLRGPVLVQVGTAGMVAFLSLGVAAIVLFAMLTQGALVRTTIAYEAGRKAGFGESVGAGLSRALPLLGLAIVMAIALSVSFLLLIVPAVILYVIWSVASPALVDEQIGVFQALGRSAELTKGTRWKVFGLELIVLVMYWLVSAALGIILVLAFGGAAGMAASMRTGGLPWWYHAINLSVGTLVSAVWASVQTSLFVELRHWKDGPPAEALAEVFA